MPRISKTTETRSWARIDLGALRSNVERVRSLAPDSRVMAVIKANAYGHGAVLVAKALEGVDAFAVATVEEGLRLRAQEIQAPINVLSGPLFEADVALAEQHELGLVLHREQQLDWCEGFSGSVWIKLDTGMHRLGFPLDDGSKLVAWLSKNKRSHFAGWMTHLACADDSKSDATRKQVAAFRAAISVYSGEQSIANSAGICGWPDSHADWVRPGIMLYGSSPLLRQGRAELGLQPVMHLHSRLIAVQHLQAGDSIGYGATWQCPEAMPVGIVGIGYGDGYPRHAKSGTPVSINGRRCELIGRVSMDMIAVDLRPEPNASVGDIAQLWGDQIDADEVADCCGTIAYELFCGVGQRVVFYYD